MKVFYSYCHLDEDSRITLEKYLTTLKTEGQISEWHDRKILPGDVWSKEIERNLQAADIVLLLVTQDYIASEACAAELEFAFANSDSKTIVPIIVKPSTWLDTKCSIIQALPRDGKPISSWVDKDEAWLDVYKGLKKVIQKKNEITSKASFLNSLEQVSFVSAAKDSVNLSDIFIWPEFRLHSLSGADEAISCESERFISEKGEYSFIKGVELSGKTSLVRKIFIEASARGEYALILDGSTIFKKIDFDAIAIEAFKAQYNGEFKEFLKFPKKILIVDDFHHKISHNFLTWARSRFQNILLVIEEEEHMLYYKDDESFADFNLFTIRSFNRTKTYDLITKWKCLDQTYVCGTEDFDRSVDDLELKVRAIINGSRIVPSYPFYILSVLQAFEGFLPSDYKITSYGHCYTSLITAQLLKKAIHYNDIGDCFNYLTYIAFNMYCTRSTSISDVSIDEYKKIKARYKQEYLIKDSLISRIEDTNYPILKINTQVKFEYLYIYYFFIGKYLAEKSDVSIIVKLCETIYKRESANILIFTIHHTTNTDLLDEIQLHCMLAFDNHKAATLTKEETDFISSLMAEMPKQLVNRKSVEVNRTEERKQQDTVEREHDSIYEDVDPKETNKEIVAVQRSLKIIEVLGQIIKNRAGTFDKKKVKELVIEVEQLGFRLLTYFLDTLKDPEFAKWMEARLGAIEKEKQEERKEFDKAARRVCVRKNIQLMGVAIILSIINKIFYSLSTEKILKIQEEVSEQFSIPAYDILSIIFKLNYKGVRYTEIKHYHKLFLESKNIWASRTLSLLVLRYLNTHNVDFNIRQQVSSLLDITYTPNRTGKN